jgi:2-phosphosulfolactate phosphatase
MMNPIRVEAVFIPKEINSARRPVCVLVDAIRASSTIVTLFEKGFKQILLTSDEVKSTLLDKRIIAENFCICAEKVEGTKADSADVSPSLADLRCFPDGEGRKVLFRTTNGTEGIRNISARGIGDIFVGSMLNRDALARAVVRRAVQTKAGICFAAAGRENGNIYCIDDVYCCASLIIAVLEYAKENGYDVELFDSAKIALNMAGYYKTVEEAFSQSATGEVMRRSGSEEDIYLCAQGNISSIVPKVTGIDEFGHVVVDVYDE